MKNRPTNGLILSIEKLRLKNTRFIILSNNCWGYEIYQTLGRQYNTPFVGLFMFPECYIEFLDNFKQCIESHIDFVSKSKYIHDAASCLYPIGVINKHIEIHFLHYSSENEALEKWSRRIDRLKIDINSGVDIFIKFCDRDGCTREHLERYNSLPFKNKISIGVKPFNAVNYLYQPKLKDPQGMYTLNGLDLYRKRYHYFDISCWLKNGIVRRSSISRFLSLIS